MTMTSSSTGSLRIGAVSYVNTRPLIYGLESAGYNLILDTPARLAEMLGAGEVDVALISTAEYLRGDEYRIVDAGCIACRGEVMSVRVFSEVAASAIQAIRFDAASRSANALVRILARHLWRIEPEWIEADSHASGEEFPTSDSGQNIADLVIGNRALHRLNSALVELDLGQGWYELTKLPFVFAVWAARKDADMGDLPEALAAAKAAGLQARDELAREAAGEMELPEGLLQRYLHEAIRYELGREELVGIEYYYRLLRDLRLVPEFAGLQFAG